MFSSKLKDDWERKQTYRTYGNTSILYHNRETEVPDIAKGLNVEQNNSIFYKSREDRVH